jgi:hypothetical protein
VALNQLAAWALQVVLHLTQFFEVTSSDLCPCSSGTVAPYDFRKAATTSSQVDVHGRHVAPLLSLRKY